MLGLVIHVSKSALEVLYAEERGYHVGLGSDLRWAPSPYLHQCWFIGQLYHQIHFRAARHSSGNGLAPTGAEPFT